MNQILWIAIGGAIGAVLRYLMVMGIANLFPLDFPLPTLLVNIVGCFAIGLVFAIWSGSDVFNSSIKPFLVIGVLGGFTTFSSYSMEVIILFQQNAGYKAIGYFLLSNLLGIAAAFFGYKLFQG